MNELLPYQAEGVDFLSSRTHAMLCDEMGLGKTIQAIAAINKLGARKVLIVCPATLKLNWKRELEKWLEKKRVIQVLSTSQAVVNDETDILIVNYDLITYGMGSSLKVRGHHDLAHITTRRSIIYNQIFSRQWAVGIFDESHYLKNKGALRTKAILQKDRIASRCIYKWFLTGTPILNRPSELYPVFRAVFPEVIHPYLNYAAYAKYFCGAHFNGKFYNDRGATNIPEMARRIQRAGIMLRRLKREVLIDLPDKTYQLIPLLDSTEAPQRYMSADLIWSKKLRHQDLGRVCSNLGEMAEHRHDTARVKLPYAIEHLKSILETVSKVVVFAHHTDIIDAIHTEFNDISVVVDGRTAQGARQAAVDLFQENPKCRMFIGQIQAAGVGITLTAASTVVFVENSWVPGEIAQAIDRCHRIGQKEAVLAQFLIIADTIEEHMLATVIQKLKTIKTIHGEN